MARGLSDHRPIKHSPMEVDWGSKPFSFENCWLNHKDFLLMVKHFWSSFEVTSFVGFIIIKKLQMLKENIKVWNRESFGNIEYSRVSLTKELEVLDSMEESRDLN